MEGRAEQSVCHGRAVDRLLAALASTQQQAGGTATYTNPRAALPCDGSRTCGYSPGRLRALTSCRRGSTRTKEKNWRLSDMLFRYICVPSRPSMSFACSRLLSTTDCVSGVQSNAVSGELLGHTSRTANKAPQKPNSNVRDDQVNSASLTKDRRLDDHGVVVHHGRRGLHRNHPVVVDKARGLFGLGAWLSKVEDPGEAGRRAGRNRNVQGKEESIVEDVQGHFTSKTKCRRETRERQSRASGCNSLSDAAVKGVEVWRAELRAPHPAAGAAPLSTAHETVARLHADETVAAHRFCCRIR